MTFSQLRTPLALFGSRSKTRATDPRFQHLADQLEQLILLVSPHADRIVAANAHAAKFFGRSHEAICAAPLSELLAQDAEQLLLDLKTLGARLYADTWQFAVARQRWGAPQRRLASNMH